jgi:hypothetical protein
MIVRGVTRGEHILLQEVAIIAGSQTILAERNNLPGEMLCAGGLFKSGRMFCYWIFYANHSKFITDFICYIFLSQSAKLNCGVDVERRYFI